MPFFMTNLVQYLFSEMNKRVNFAISVVSTQRPRYDARMRSLIPGILLLGIAACSDGPGRSADELPAEQTLDAEADDRPPQASSRSDAGRARDARALLDAGQSQGDLARDSAVVRSFDGASDGAQDGGAAHDAADGAQLLDGGDAALACVDCCRDGLPRGERAQQRRMYTFTPSPEGVAVCPSGEVFVALGSTGEVWKVGEDGGAERWTTLTGRQPAGIACDDQGRLFVADMGGLAPALAPAIVMVEAKGDEGKALAHDQPDLAGAGLNGIVAVPGHGIYASGTYAGSIYHFDEQADGGYRGTLAKAELAGANGLAYDPHTAKLYAALSNMVGGANKVVALDVAADGSLGAPSVLWEGRNVVDGVAADEHGEVYVAYYEDGTVVRISDQSVVARTVNPASLAFRGGTLLVTDYKVVSSLLEALVPLPRASGNLEAVALGVCGAR
jgi:sugar lactone lactonase YvrE